MSDRFSTRLVILLLAAALLRVIFSVFVVGWQAPPRGDEVDFHAISQQLAAGEGFTLAEDIPTARRPPLYPVFLSVFYKLFGSRVAVARILQILLGTAVVLLVYAAAKRNFSSKSAWIAAGLTAFNPFLIFISAYLLTENLYMVLLLGSLLVLPGGKMMRYSPGRLAAAALLLSLLSLARPTGFPVFAFVFCFLALSGNGPIRARLARLVLIAAVFLIPFVPWVTRNYAAFGETIFFTTHGGIAFYQGNNEAVRDIPRYHGGVAPLHALPDKFQHNAGEVENNSEALRKGMKFIRENPGDMPVMVWRKLVRFWRLKSDVGLSGVKSGWWWDKGGFLGNLASTIDVGFVYSIAVMPFFVIGLFVCLRRFRKLAFGYGAIIMHTLIAMAFYGSLRSRIPIEPFIAMFAAAGFMKLADWIRTRRTSPDPL
jgi:4-amino-4-deoxy-L-arabinose transferase-like glycosyltransferase